MTKTISAAPPTSETLAATDSESEIRDWSVYMILCSDQTLYTGITTDIQKRWHAHSHTRRGAKFFRGRSPLQLVYLESGHCRASASRREAEVKKLRRSHKLSLLQQQAGIDWHRRLALTRPAGDGAV